MSTEPAQSSQHPDSVAQRQSALRLARRWAHIHVAYLVAVLAVLAYALFAIARTAGGSGSDPGQDLVVALASIGIAALVVSVSPSSPRAVLAVLRSRDETIGRVIAIRPATRRTLRAYLATTGGHAYRERGVFEVILAVGDEVVVAQAILHKEATLDSRGPKAAKETLHRARVLLVGRVGSGGPGALVPIPHPGRLSPVDSVIWCFLKPVATPEN